LIKIKIFDKISEIVLENHILILPLEHFGINFPIHDKSFSNICAEKEISENLLLSVLNLFIDTNSNDNMILNPKEIIQIVEYLKNCHDYYLNEKLIKIEDYICEISKINRNNEVLLVQKFIDEYLTEVRNHLDYENNIVFPYIEKLANNYNLNINFISSEFSVSEFHEHHDNIEEKLNDLKNLIIKYIHLKGDNSVRRKLLFELFEFEADLKIHSKIEEVFLILSVAILENLNK
jgi:regulator of cell morphogenesis and NO signaling